MFYGFPGARTKPGSISLRELYSTRQEPRNQQPFCQHSDITTPCDPPYPPFLRGEITRGCASAGLKLPQLGPCEV